MASMARGWSRQGRAYYGRHTAPSTDDDEPEGCYYCGVPHCQDCGEPPTMLTDLERDYGD